MELFQIDRYSTLSSPVHRLHPPVKLVSFLVFVVLIVLSPKSSFAPMIVGLLTLCCIALASRVPVGYIISRSLIIIPFVLAIGAFNLLGKNSQSASHSGAAISLMAGSSGYFLFLNMAAKAFVSVLGMTLLVSTTGTTRLSGAMRTIRVPILLTVAICLMFRYISVAVDELAKMKRSRDSRCAGKLPRVFELRSLGALVGVLFMRSYERAERVYMSMCCRGFDGFAIVSNQGRASIRDFLFSLLLVGPVLVTILVGIAS